MRIAIPNDPLWKERNLLLRLHLESRQIVIENAPVPYLFVGDSKLAVEVVAMPELSAQLLLSSGLIEGAVGPPYIHGYPSETTSWPLQPWSAISGEMVMKIEVIYVEFTSHWPVWILSPLPAEHRKVLLQFIRENFPNALSLI